MKNTYNFLKRNYQDYGQWFLGIARYTQNRSQWDSGSSLSFALGQASATQPYYEAPGDLWVVLEIVL